MRFINDITFFRFVIFCLCICNAERVRLFIFNSMCDMRWRDDSLNKCWINTHTHSISRWALKWINFTLFRIRFWQTLDTVASIGHYEFERIDFRFHFPFSSFDFWLWHMVLSFGFPIYFSFAEIQDPKSIRSVLWISGINMCSPFVSCHLFQILAPVIQQASFRFDTKHTEQWKMWKANTYKNNDHQMHSLYKVRVSLNVTAEHKDF